MIVSRLLPRTVVVTLAVAVALAPGLGGMGGQAAADDTSTVELVLQDLDFIVEDALRLEFVVVGDAPDVAPPTTSTTTVPDTTVAPDDDQAEAESDLAATPTSPSTTSTTSTSFHQHLLDIYHTEVYML